MTPWQSVIHLEIWFTTLPRSLPHCHEWGRLLSGHALSYISAYRDFEIFVSIHLHYIGVITFKNIGRCQHGEVRKSLFSNLVAPLSLCVYVLGCSVVPWCMASLGIWKGAELLNPSLSGVPCPDNCTPPCWMLWGTVNPILPHRQQGGGREVGDGEGEEEAEVGEERGVRTEALGRWPTSLLSWWAKESLIMIID